MFFNYSTAAQVLTVYIKRATGYLYFNCRRVLQKCVMCVCVCLLMGVCWCVIFTGRWCRSVPLDCGWQSRRARSRPIHTTPSSRCCSARIAPWHHHPGIRRWVAIGRKNLRKERLIGEHIDEWLMSTDCMTYFEGEEDGEPGEHSRWMCIWFYTCHKHAQYKN